jgi:phosphoglucomutase
VENILQTLAQAKTDGEISETAYNNVEKWLINAEYRDYRQEIITLVNEGKFRELEDCFYTIIPFGTGGRRGMCGIGPNRINTRTIGESAQGLAAYIVGFGEEVKRRGVVIAYDTRNTSQEFADYTARVLTGNGIRTYLFTSFRATPELSYAVRKLGTMAGIVISASHNPPSDNGFKVYWEDGGQIVPPHDTAIIAQVNQVAALQLADLAEAAKQGLLTYIDKELDEPYIQEVLALSLISNRDVTLVYSPLHGTGQKSILPVLQRAGFARLHVVEQQMVPDGNFPYVKDHFPNPELPAVFEMAMDLAKQVDADLGMTSDPDADRLGVFCKHTTAQGEQQWILLNGNQVGVVLVDFLLNTLHQQDKLPDSGVVVKTLVTTDLVSVIARDFGMRTVDDLLVGFKYIGEVIRNLPEHEQFLLGVEESLGYLRGTFGRDKDAATAAITLAELAAELKAQGKSVYDRLNDIYKQYGYFAETLKDLYVKGAKGIARVNRMMKGLRAQPPKELAGTHVVEVIDRKTGNITDPKTGNILREVEGAKGDVLVFVLSMDGHTRVTIRPSGTEPKIKYYGAIKAETTPGMSDVELEQLKAATLEQLDSYMESLIAEVEKY